MKIKGLLLSLFVTSSLLSIAQDIKLPSPQKQGGEPLLQVLSKRASTRDFDTQKNIDSQTLSNLLWAAWGYNREDKRTAPSAMNRQEISLYIVTAQGVYLYDAKQNKLGGKSPKEISGKTQACNRSYTLRLSTLFLLPIWKKRRVTT